MEKYYDRMAWMWVAVCLSPVWMFAQTAPAASIFDHLIAQGVTDVTITTDLAAITTEQEPRNGEEAISAVLTYLTADQVEESWELELAIRGKFRRRICDFPPLKLDFSKKDLQARGLAEFDKYKLVTHCQEDRQAAREAVLREYTAYQLYNVLTPASYNVHLLRVTYADAAGKIPDLRQYAFLLESTKELADRLGAEECEDCLAHANEQTDPAAANLHAVFQYMIGNTDFNLPMLRNVKLFVSPGQPALPVAYDFDFSALVNVPYAIPAREFGQTSIHNRVFLGAQVSDVQMEATLALFEQKRETLFEVIKEQRLLSINSRSEMRVLLKSFYTQLSDLRQNGKARTYSQLRDTSAEVVPPGAKPEDFGVRR